MPKEGRHMKVGLIRRAPRPIQLRRKRARRRDRAEEIHAPFGPPGPALIHVEEPQWDLNRRDPRVLVRVECCRRGEALRCRVGEVGSGEDGVCGADLGRVVDPGAEGLVVGGDFELEVVLWVVDAAILQGENGKCVSSYGWSVMPADMATEAICLLI